jgi:hypothetical protein
MRLWQNTPWHNTHNLFLRCQLIQGMGQAKHCPGRYLGFSAGLNVGYLLYRYCMYYARAHIKVRPQKDRY